MPSQRRQPLTPRHQRPLQEKQFEGQFESTPDLSTWEACQKNPSEADLSQESMGPEFFKMNESELKNSHQVDGLEQKIADYSLQLQACMHQLKGITSGMSQLIDEKSQLEAKAEVFKRENLELKKELTVWKNNLTRMRAGIMAELSAEKFPASVMSTGDK